MCSNVRDLVRACRDNYSQDNLSQIIDAIKEVRTVTIDFDVQITDAIDEAISLLLDENLTPVKISNASKLTAACGRSMQYVSLVRKFR